MPVLINPLMMQDADQKTLLRALLESNKLCVQWKKDQIYSVLNQQIQLAHTILLASSRDERLSYRVLLNHIGEGLFAKVYSIACTFSFPDENSIEYSQQNMLVVKIQTFPPGDETIMHKRKASCLREHAFSSMTSHIGMEPPKVLIDRTSGTMMSFMFMNHMPGVELFDILNMHCEFYLPSKFLFKLTMALLTAYKEQVMDLAGGMLHLDVKPENIMVDVGLSRTNLENLFHPDFVPERLIIKFIDYAACVKHHDTIKTMRGTKDYAAPEILSITEATALHDEKPDIYSLGICLKLLWFGNYDLLSQNHIGYSQQIDQIYHCLYASDILRFSKRELMSIHQAIISMTLTDPENRWSLSQSMAKFNSLVRPELPSTNTCFNFFRPLTLSDSNQHEENLTVADSQFPT